VPADDREALDRAADAAASGARDLAPDEATALVGSAAGDPDPRVRAAALGALTRAGTAAEALPAWARAARDPSSAVRRRAAETAPVLGAGPALGDLLALLHDDDIWVAEAAAFALGERDDLSATAVRALADVAVDHADPLVRESAVAALGAIGDPAGLAAVLHGCADKPAIRRRAVLALAAFDGTEVEAALERALDDADWQVRQNAEDLLRESAEE
jgi:HEAT repeat protein